MRMICIFYKRAQNDSYIRGGRCMSKKVTLRKSGNSLIFTAPSELTDKVGTKYSVTQHEDGSVLYTPVEHVNVFSTEEFKKHDFRRDLEEIPEAGEVKPVGREKLL